MEPPALRRRPVALLLRLLLFVPLGFVIGWIATAAAALFYGEIAGVSQAEGAFAMGAVFLLGPAGGVVGAILGVLLALRRPRPPA
jgi:hypothetical protein